MTHQPIDFQRLAEALLSRVDSLMQQWLPAGFEKGGRWYVGDFDGNAGESANVSLTTGTWIDNGGGEEDKGGDLISLYARLNNLNNGQAARELMRDLGWERPSDTRQPVAHQTDREAPPNSAPPAPAVEGGEGPAPASRKRTPKWVAVAPVPAIAMLKEPDFEFGYKDSKQGNVWVKQQATRTWAYWLDGQLYGYVARFERISSDGELRKDTVARTWCENVEEGGPGGFRWHWKQWEQPRPLYVPAKTLADPARPVVIVEGEKCAEAGHQLLGEEFDFVSWPGGCKAWAQADWSWVAGRTVYLWPDCDAQPERLTKAEREAGTDSKSKALLPAHKQPGVLAMVQIGTVLLADRQCIVNLCKIPAPGAVSDGWDIADAIASGWTADQVRGFIRAATVFEPLDDEARAKAAGSSPAAAASEAAGDAIGWRDLLIKQSPGGPIKPVRENVVLAIDGHTTETGRRVPGIPEAEGIIAFNEFTNDVIKLRDTPWGTRAGVWEEVDELELGNWLSRSHWLPSMSRQTLEEATLMLARRHRFHPARERFEKLRCTWDGTKRLRYWLMRCCRAAGRAQQGEELEQLEQRLQDLAETDQLGQYLARVGTWVCMAIAARVMRPGCKFDYMLILEGGQGMGKSTLARCLGGDWFADTGLVLGDKDSYQNLQGVSVYEWGELDSLTRAEVTKVKQFISSQSDRFRASFDRRPRDYPRQVVFVGTTNESQYLSDPTGNRRFWPVKVECQINLRWLRANLDQLFAEALSYLEAGARFHPTPHEQADLFDPQQTERTIENALESAIRRYLYDDGQTVAMGRANGALIDALTIADLLTALSISVDKQTPQLMKQASQALTRLGWVKGRASGAGGVTVRPWLYRRPKDAPGQVPSVSGPSTPPQGNNDGTGNVCPF